MGFCDDTWLDVMRKLANPTLELYDADGKLVASNDDWRSNQEAEIIATTIPPSKDRESPIMQTLDPAPYTAVVRGVGNTTGVALVEVFGLNYRADGSPPANRNSGSSTSQENCHQTNTNQRRFHVSTDSTHN